MDGYNTAEDFLREEDAKARGRYYSRPNGHDAHGPEGIDDDKNASAVHPADMLDVHTWAKLDIPPEPRLLGGLITPSARVFLVGRTGLGKTLFAHAMAAGMATGQGFLHWRSDRPSRWLIIDGEMPSALIKARAADALRRVGDIPARHLTVYSLDRAEQFAQLMPGLGILEPINTDSGKKFVLELARLVEPEGIMFDNVMSLISGDQKDEVPWSQTLPLVAELTRRGIAQVYLDHTGHNTDRQYGSSTKGWRMDAIGLMTPLPAGEYRARGEAPFHLSFEHPAKARRRVADNWGDFETTTIRLTEDRWTSEVANTETTKLSPNAKLWYAALLDALCHSETPGRTTRTEWYAEAVRTNLTETIGKNDSPA